MEIEDAIRNAKAFAAKSLGPDRTADIRLEEIESSMTSKGSPVWLITLSSAESHPPGWISTKPFSALGADSEREYKVFTVRKDTGEVLAMKIRLLAAPGM